MLPIRTWAACCASILETGETVATIEVGAGARFFAVGAGAVWVQNNVDATVSRVDPTTDEVVATIVVDDFPIDGGDLAVGGGFVWGLRELVAGVQDRPGDQHRGRALRTAGGQWIGRRG